MTNRTKEDYPSGQLDTSKVTSFVEDRYPFLLTKKAIELSGGTESSAWLIHAGKERFVVKFFSPSESFADVENEVKLYSFLNSNGFNAPKVISGKKGKRVEKYETFDRKYSVIVMKYENLRVATPSTVKEEEIRKIAKQTAGFHLLLQNYPVKNKPDNLIAIVKSQIRKTGPAFPALSSSINKDAFTQKELEAIIRTDTKAVQYLKTVEVSPPLVGSLIHSDLALEHTPFLPNGEVYFYDWTDRRWFAVAGELATTFVHLFRDEDITFERWNNLRNWFRDEYTAVLPLGNNDIDIIKPLMITRILVASRYLCNLAKELGTEVNSAGVRRMFKLAKHLLSHLP